MSHRSLTTQLAVRLDITRVVTTDAIRDVLRTVVPVNVLPELHQSTFEVVAPDTVDPFAGSSASARPWAPLRSRPRTAWPTSTAR